MDTPMLVHHTIPRVAVHPRGTGVMMGIRIDAGIIANGYATEPGPLELAREESPRAIDLAALAGRQTPVQLRPWKSEGVVPRA